MKYTFIAINSQYIHSCLSLQGLAELARPFGDVCLHEFTVNQDYRAILQLVEQADCYFLSCYIWNRQMVLSLMQDLKKIYPGARVYVGGPEAQANRDDFLNWGDGVFLGEGETPLLELLAGSTPKSLHTKQQTGVISREDRLDFPYPFSWVDPDRIVYYESQRGCPYHCSYCMSAEVDRLVDRPIELVKSDLSRLVDMGAKLIKLTDRSFNAKPERCLELIDFFGQFEQSVTFHVELSPYGLNQATIDAISRLPKDRLQVEVGFQALQPHILQAIQRPAYSERVFTLLKQLMALPLHRHIDLIAGLPGMSLADTAETFDYLFSLRPDDLQVGFLKVLPGTPLASQAGLLGLVSSSSPPYEILRTRDISFQELNQLKDIEALAKWFHPQAFPATFDYLEPNIESPFAFYRQLAQEDSISQKSLENRLRQVQARLGDETVKEYLEIDYHRQRRHRKHLFFRDRRLTIHQIRQGGLLEMIQSKIPDIDPQRLEERISLYRTNTSHPLILYDYDQGKTYFLGE